MKIHIEKLCFNAIIGILDHERVTPQLIELDMIVEYSPNNNNDFIDYAQIVNLVSEYTKRSKFYLIEEALDALHAKIKDTFPAISYTYIKLSKPNILENCIVGVSDTKHYKLN